VSQGNRTSATGETTKTITVQVKGDTKVEGDETFFVNVSGANGTKSRNRRSHFGSPGS
jgi:hypothetical protein